MAILSMPSTLRAGDSWSFTAAPASYPGPDWVLALVLVNADATESLDWTWDEEAESHSLAVTPAESVLYAAGLYAWHLIATNDTDSLRATLESGTVEVLPDPVTATPAAVPSQARQILTALDATIQNRATAGEADLVRAACRDRQVEYDLLGWFRLRAIYAAIVAAEQADANRAAGLTSGFVQVAFK